MKQFEDNADQKCEEMQKYPNMSSEIMEAICEYYTDDDILTDCLLHFVGLCCHQSLLKTSLCRLAKEHLKDMDRCIKCGEKLKIRSYGEPHTELDGFPIERIDELYCPMCELDCNKNN